MKKVYQDCKEESRFWSTAETRVELAMKKGDSFSIPFKHCGSSNEVSVDSCYAKESKSALTIAGLVFLVGTPLLFYFTYGVLANYLVNYRIYFVGGFLLIPSIVFGLIRKQKIVKVRAFNRHKLKK